MFGLDPVILALAVAVTLFGGFVKGVVGFAMPMIMISGMASFMPAEQALAALILPTFATNLMQSLRQGWRSAWAAVKSFRLLIGTTCLFIAISAQIMTAIPQPVLLAALGFPIILFALAELTHQKIRFQATNRPRAEIATGVIGGLYGGVSGIWGPPTIALLLSLNVEKRESVQVQGVVYLIGSAMLLAAHLGSGIANAQTLPLSLILVIPGMAGLALGFRVQDKLDTGVFRRWTLIVLAVSGLNLIRRAAGY